MEQVSIWKSGSACEIQSPPEDIGKVLRTGAHVALNVGNGCTLARGNRLLHEVRDDIDVQWLAFPSGLLPVVQQLLAQRGITVRFLGEPQTELPAPDSARVAAFDPADLDLVEMISRHERALIRCAPTADLARLVAQVARAWPDAKIAVTAVSRDDVRTMARALRQYGLAVSVIIPGSVPESVERLVVTTYLGLGESAEYRGPQFACFDLHHLDIVIAVDALEAVGAEPLECLSRTTRARLYGLLPLDVEPAPFERDLMFSLFGFGQLIIPRHGCHERLVHLATQTITGGQPLPAKLIDPELKRLGIWRHGRRNRAIAAVARAIQHGDRTRLQGLCPAAATALANVPAPVVWVVVDNVEHALALHQHLPDWQIRTGPPLYTGGLTKRERRQLIIGRSPSICSVGSCIVTTVAMEQADISPVDVLIRCDGGTDLPPITHDQLAQAHDDRRPLLIIDFQDRHHPALRRRSRQRLQACAKRGWFPVGVEPAQGQVSQFLAQRTQEAK